MSKRKSLFLALIVFCFFASACSPAKTAPPVTVVLLSTVTPTLTVAPLPTATPLPETPATQTALPAASPTFDVSAIVTVTKAPANAACPEENLDTSSANIMPADRNSYTDKDFINRVLSFLNAGGSTTSLALELKKPNTSGKAYAIFDQKDITNDGIPELLIRKSYEYYVLKCSQDQYVKIYSEEQFTVTNAILVDLNKNAIPELKITTDFCVDRNCIETWLLEWDGAQLKTLLHSTDDVISIVDQNHDGLQEVIGIEYPNYRYNEPTDRDITTIYTWNGVVFAGKSSFGDAKYRFQAIQDADSAAATGEYTQALKLYEDAITSNTLKRWSPALDKYYDAFSDDKPAAPTPPPDHLSESVKLAAYATYRMMILHAYLSQDDAAAKLYNTLQEKFPADSPGHPYAEMASAFWGVYQSSRSVSNACGVSIRYAEQHPEILTVLGSDYHGAQSRKYVPADVCPFG